MSKTTQLLVAWAGLLVSAWPLDRLVEHFVRKLPPKSLLRATDTAVHGLIGGFSYWLACIICSDLVLNVCVLLPYLGFGCGSNKTEASKEPLPLNVFFSFCVAFMLSSCIDLDHITDNIIHIINAQSPAPWKRGWLHLSLPPLALSCILYSSSLSFHSLWCVVCATLSILSIFSHHIRDAVHHGLDFYPLGSTPIMPYWLYIAVTLTLPVMTSFLSVAVIQQIKSSQKHPMGNLFLV